MASRLKYKDTYFTEKSVADQFTYIEIKINKDDTLLSLSMKFNCTIIDLKRLNSLQNDREMFALKTLKIPIKKHSSMAQEYASELKYGDVNFSRLKSNVVLDHTIENDVYKNSDDYDSEDTTSSISFPAATRQNGTLPGESLLSNKIDMDVDIEDYFEGSALINKESKHNRSFSENHLSNMSNVKDAKRFLKQKDKELTSLRHQNEEIINNLNKSTNSLNEQLIPISDFSVNRTDRLNINGSYYNVRDILIVACFIIVIVPLSIFIYRSYYEDHN